jgi:predicted nucleotidyltransferase
VTKIPTGSKPKQLNLNPRNAAALQDFVQKVRATLRERLAALRLFGSKAQGRDTRDSDIDVLVLVHPYSLKIEDQVLDIAFDVNLEHEVYISPRVIGREVLEDPVWKITPFIQELENGVPL